MKMFLISDNVDTQTGMRLAGVERDRNYSPYRKVREGIPGHSGGCPPQP